MIFVTDEDLINDLPTAWDKDLYLEEFGSNPLLKKRLEIVQKETNASLNRTLGTRFSERRFSRIDVIDKVFYINTLNERNRLLRQKKVDKEKKEFDLI